MRSPGSGFRSRALGAAVGSLALLPATLGWSGAAVAEPSVTSRATITGSFSDGCRDFTSRATKVVSQEGKDISYVELHYADGRIIKNETINGPDYSLAGAAGDELAFAIVKSGTTTEPFDCALENRPPSALLEIKTPPVDETLEHCHRFFDGTACEQSAPRTSWSSVSDITNDLGSLLTWDCGGLSDRSLCSFTIGLRGTSSTDADNDIASWSIDFGDGTSAGGSWTAEPPTEVAHGYFTSGFDCIGFGGLGFICPVTLTVTDSAGQSDSDTMLMWFRDSSPD